MATPEEANMQAFERARALFTQALDHHNRGQFAPAERLYRQALELAPDRLSILVNLTSVLIQQQRHDDARTYNARALAIDPACPDAVEHARLLLPDVGNPAARLAASETALRNAPEDPAAHNNHGLLLLDLDRPAEALTQFDRALALQPGELLPRVNRARTHERLGQGALAFADYRQALAISPEFEPAGIGFANLALAHAPAGDDVAFDGLLALALTQPWHSPRSLAGLAISRLKRLPEIVAAREALEPGHIGPAATLDVAASLARIPLLLALLRNVPVTDIGFETLLCMLRAELLNNVTRIRAQSAEPAHKRACLELCTALAMQCFLNEYVWPIPGTEAESAAAVLEQIETAIAGRVAPDVIAVAVVASYQPLHSVRGIRALAPPDATHDLAPLFEQQVLAPASERDLQPHIVRATAVSDSVSLQVQAQYEQNPYPRWSALPMAGARVPLAEFVASRVATVGPPPLPARTDARYHVLNAGCGTGQQPIDLALRVNDVRVLAIDLSLASLAYGARMAARHRVTDLYFAQADLLRIGELGERFDLIESTGVLHHLRDPEQGLAALRAVLASGGLMRLALYSRQGRRHVTAAREWLSSRGYNGASADAIRRARTDIALLPSGEPARRVTEFTDFYALSECRDLLFHVQESTFSLPEIARLLERHRLAFVGMEADARLVAAFRGTNPAAALDDLAAWDAFERAQPDSFNGMYVFWVRDSG